MNTAPDPAPMSEEELASFRRRANAHIPGSDHYMYSVDGIVYDGHFMHDARRLLAEVDRLRAELATVADEAAAQCREAAARTVRAEKERDALAAAVKTVATALDNLGGRVYRDFNSDYSEVADSVILREFNAYTEEQLAVLDDPKVRAALGETGGTDG